MEADDTSKVIVKRLNVIIYLLIRKELGDNGFTKKDLIKLMNNLGLKYDEIAETIGKSKSYVSSELSKMKKGEKNSRSV